MIVDFAKEIVHRNAGERMMQFDVRVSNRADLKRRRLKRRWPRHHIIVDVIRMRDTSSHATIIVKVDDRSQGDLF